MKNIFKYNLQLKTLLSLVIICFTSCETDKIQTIATLSNLVWQDEFDANGAPDATKWNIVTGDGSDTAAGKGFGNNELQIYTDDTKNITAQNGVLIITANQEGSSYTSARINTKGLFQQKHGRFEARIKLPTGKGLWPAFWLLGDDENGTLSWPQIGEIDIMEYLGDAPTVVFGSIHGPGYNFADDDLLVDAITKEYQLENDRFDNGFHIFGIEWGPKSINYYVDGDLYQTITPETVADETNGLGKWVFNDRPFYIILNVAVGGDFPGSPNAETVFPQRMLVDYVRVYN